MHIFFRTTVLSTCAAVKTDSELGLSTKTSILQPMRTLGTGFVMLLAYLAAGFNSFAESENENYFFRAQLIWASNEDLSSDDLHPLDDKTTEKLRKVFKWENYWEINNKYVDLKEDVRKITKISPECEISLKRIETEEECKVEVVLIGKKNPIVKKTQHINQDECLVLAGPDKDGTAWFVILTRVVKIPEDADEDASSPEIEDPGAKICYCCGAFRSAEPVTLFTL